MSPRANSERQSQALTLGPPKLARIGFASQAWTEVICLHPYQKFHRIGEGNASLRDPEAVMASMIAAANRAATLQIPIAA